MRLTISTRAVFQTKQPLRRYRYIKKTERSQRYYAVEEAEAEIVRKVFAWYTNLLGKVA